MVMASHSCVVNLVPVFKYICYFLDRMLENIFQRTAQESAPKFSKLRFEIELLFGIIEFNQLIISLTKTIKTD